MKKLVLALALLFMAWPSLAAQRLSPNDCRVFSAIGAGADHSSTTVETGSIGKKLDFGYYRSSSFHAVWTGITGSVDGVIAVQVSNDGTNWMDKSSATITMSGAAGQDEISITSVTEYYYRVQLRHNSMTGGSVSVNCAAKEF